jgi:excisionase family DNA binding protein
MPDRLLYRVEEVAELLAIGRSKTYELIASDGLPVVHLGRCVRVPAEALQHWLAAQGAFRRLCGGLAPFAATRYNRGMIQTPVPRVPEQRAPMPALAPALVLA